MFLYPATKRAGDALYISGDSQHSISGARFSTWDRDQDNSTINHCAQELQVVYEVRSVKSVVFFLNHKCGELLTLHFVMLMTT